MCAQQILIRPDELRSAADRLLKNAHNIQHAIEHTDEAMRLPTHVLAGHQAENILRRYHSQRDRLKGTQQLIIYFANQLKQIADRFEHADRKIVSASSGLGQNQGEGIFWFPDLWKIIGHFFDGLGSLSKIYLDVINQFVKNRGDFKELLKALGLKKFYSIFSHGIPYRGPMDKFLRGDLFKGFFKALGVFYDTFQDVKNGVLFPEALGVNGLNELEKIGLEALVPEMALVFLANAGNQIVGDLSVEAQKMLVEVISPDAPMRELLMMSADDFGKAYDKTNIENITKEFGRTLYNVYLADSVDVGTKSAAGLWDWAANDRSLGGLSTRMDSLIQYSNQKFPTSKSIQYSVPLLPLFLDPRGRDGLGKTFNAAKGVVEGVQEVKSAGVNNMVKFGVAGVAKVVNQVPGLSSGQRAVINEGAYQFIRTGPRIPVF